MAYPVFLFIFVYWCSIRFLCQMIFVSCYSNTTGAANGAGTVHPSRAPEITMFFSGVRVVRSLVFCVMFCRSLCPFVLFHLTIVLTIVLRFMSSDYHFDIFKLFFFCILISSCRINLASFK